ncbi:hypothetical protein J6590_048327 [Homalodisca vitripennis]|nr:hypothetical protein J6590_048327 [Homalodisca vitripennis]
MDTKPSPSIRGRICPTPLPSVFETAVPVYSLVHVIICAGTTLHELADLVRSTKLTELMSGLLACEVTPGTRPYHPDKLSTQVNYNMKPNYQNVTDRNALYQRPSQRTSKVLTDSLRNFAERQGMISSPGKFSSRFTPK